MSGDFSPAQIRGCLDGQKLRSLELRRGSVTNLGFLGTYQNLRRLHLQDCPEISSLASLHGTPLRILILNDLPALTDISSMRALAGTPLECLFLPPNARDLSVLAEFPSLTELRLMLNNPISQEDWRYVTSLPQLDSLFLNPGELTSLASKGIRLEKPTSVSLAVEDRSSADLRDAVTVFPGMTSLNVHFAEELDLAPLSAHPRLKRVNTFTARVLNAAELPATIHLVAPAPPHGDE
ncbi:hypothetical protein GCM10010321_80280 [Streptomyces chartreusis]|nr:hypothetical protein GCM10010321_80280 [Streptomyces chartreusis]